MAYSLSKAIPQQPAVDGKTMICRGAILANGHDVTLNAPGRVVSKTTANKLQAVLNSGG